MKIMITGSRGFIGSALAEELKNRGHQVIEYDVRLGQDINDRAKVLSTLKGCDAVYHLAAVADRSIRLALRPKLIMKVSFTAMLLRK